ncbi:MAG: ECF transporter S component [Eubacteriales bacterium]|nr:ECF transporter S component [Eubacteriales bacterium]
MPVRTLATIAVLSAIAVVIMLLEFPLWFAPPFYKLDLSEIVVLMGAFALGPWAGVAIEGIKILLNFLFDGTVTGGVGELANFLIGCALVVPAAVIYRRKRTRAGALIGMAVGILTLTAVGSALNYFVLLPAYAKVFMPMEALIGMGTALNPAITDRLTFVLYAVAPFNLVKGVAVSLVTLVLYKRVRPLLHR